VLSTIPPNLQAPTGWSAAADVTKHCDFGVKPQPALPGLLLPPKNSASHFSSKLPPLPEIFGVLSPELAWQWNIDLQGFYLKAQMFHRVSNITSLSCRHLRYVTLFFLRRCLLILKGSSAYFLSDLLPLQGPELVAPGEQRARGSCAPGL
jgi:hypothetical protein